jgi:hypothetical protein
MIYLELLVFWILGNVIAWLFGADGEQLVSFWTRLIGFVAVMFTIGAIIGVGIKWGLS